MTCRRPPKLHFSARQPGNVRPSGRALSEVSRAVRPQNPRHLNLFQQAIACFARIFRWVPARVGAKWRLLGRDDESTFATDFYSSRQRIALSGGETIGIAGLSAELAPAPRPIGGLWGRLFAPEHGELGKRAVRPGHAAWGCQLRVLPVELASGGPGIGIEQARNLLEDDPPRINDTVLDRKSVV